MTQRKSMNNKPAKQVEKIIKLLTDRDSGYGLFQARGETVSKDAPVIFTPRETLDVNRLAKIIYEISDQAQQEAVKKERQRIIWEFGKLGRYVFNYDKYYKKEDVINLIEALKGE